MNGAGCSLISSDKTSLDANGYDVAHIVAQLVDAHGVPVKHVEQEIVFSVDGACRVLGVDNGSVQNVQDYQSDRLITSQGRALLILQSEREGGQVSVAARSGDAQSRAVTIDIS